ncbi:MAG: RNB domain-containing ribonuclease [Rhodocyclaceae bacterium]|jgi:exoribonuclease-2|nr:Ribonuclease R [Rhodocyclaceae bacterium]MBZ0142189.1 RNB domain-containing ribonuclease [Rhodocyclaceae bacterium]
MNVLFEEDGAFKAGTVLADNTTSLQVETGSGKRVKVKAASVLLRFAAPAPAELLERAEGESAGIEPEFLWEVCGETEFGFEDLAREYYGRPPAPIEAAAILLRLHAAPIYFHRKGKGRFRKAPPDILKAALAGLEKKRQQALAIERMAHELKSGTLPDEFPPLLKPLLYKPDRNRPETKALELACAETGLAAPHLLARCGAILSSHDYHLDRFLFEYFPQGTGFGDYEAPAVPEGLPRAEVRAFSIDDAATTEIDDAFSVTPLADGGWRIGIHIAAPGLGIRPDSALGEIARGRLSTVYMPGRKITMLPEEEIERFTLSAGRDCPALSLYLELGPDYAVRGSSSRVERVPVVANLRHHDIEPLFNEETLAAGGPDFEYRRELTLLWEFAGVLEAGRGKPAANQLNTEYGFFVDWSTPEGRIDIVERRRGSPLDKLVAELMIAANATWGKLLAEAQVAAIYRVQNAGKVRMTTAALSHEGLGVDCYAWSSSPLRRYVDLINQWQLLAHLSGEAPPFTARSEGLLSAMRDFEITYAAYAEFQRGMERYWCLRWLLQEGVEEVPARIVRESLVRLERLPLYLRCPSAPACAPRTRVNVAVSGIDLLAAEAQCRYLATLGEADGAESVEDEAVPE